MEKFRRIFVIVADSLGVGAMPDSPAFGDVGVNTLGHISQTADSFHIPTLQKLGLANITPLKQVPPASAPLAYYGKLCEKSNGKEQCRKGNSKKGNGSEKRDHQNDGAACPFWGQYSG